MSTLVLDDRFIAFSENLGTPFSPPTLSQVSNTHYRIISGTTHKATADLLATFSGSNIVSLKLQTLSGQVIATLTGVSIAPATANDIITGFNTNSALFYTSFVSVFDDNTKLTGTNGDDRYLEVGAGDDTVNAKAGDDTLYKWKPGKLNYNGGDGVDKLVFDTAQGAAPVPSAGAKIDLTAKTGTNPYGGAIKISNVENVVGTVKTDILRGDSRANVLDGNFGGHDDLRGEGGDDQLILFVSNTAPPESVFVDGGSGKDTLRYWIIGNSYVPHNIFDVVTPGNNTGVFAGSTFKNLEVYSFSYNAFGPNLPFVEFRGSSAAEEVIGTPADDTLNGNGGNDKLDAAGGKDFLNGGAGNDVLHGFSGVRFDGGSGTDIAQFGTFGFNGDLTLSLANPAVKKTLADGTTIVNVEQIEFSGFGPGKYTVTGGALRDILYGGNGNDTLRGGAGNDEITGGRGADNLVGGAGNDDLNSYDGDGPDSIDGGSGTDGVLLMRSAETRALKLDLSNPSTKKSLGDGTTYVGIERIIQFNGGSGADKVTGGSSVDNVFGNAGADILKGMGGADHLEGGLGKDKIDGGSGNDYLVGGASGDVINGGSGNDTVSYFSPSGVTINLSKKTQGGGGDGKGDQLTSIENVQASAFADTVTGNSSANILFGVGGNDTLSGGDGNDQLYGGAGKDRLTGGNGKDSFNFGAVSDMGKTSSTRDVITDFEHGIDKIDLKQIDANGGGGSNASFKFVLKEGSKLSGAKGELVWDQQNSSSKTIISGDIDGDKKADFQIELTGLIDLTKGDFIL